METKSLFDLSNLFDGSVFFSHPQTVVVLQLLILGKSPGF